MKEKYIPMADTYVIEENNLLYGFVSIIENYLAAIFVDVNSQSKGFGKVLLDYVKQDRDYIELKVFKRNNRAFDFYSRNGFTIKQELLDENLDEAEYLMVWKSEDL